MATAIKCKPYSKYKPSGVDWLGRIPEGWEIKRLKYVAAQPIKNGVGEPAEHIDEAWPRYIRITDIESPRSLYADTFRSLSPEIAAEAPVRYGDLLMAAVGATFGYSYLHLEKTGRYCYAGYLVRYSPGKEVYPLFAGYWAESIIYWNQLNANVIQSTIQNFSAAKYKELLFILPPLAEQKSIADFLNLETANIDDVVAKKQKLIELLKEKRQALITQAVTKGLDPKAKMKPSGTNWLGEIPERWEMKRLKYVAKSNTSSLAENTAPDYMFKYLDIGNVGTGLILEEPTEMYFENAPSRARRIVKKNDTIISTVRTYLKAIYHFENNPKDFIASTGFAVIEVGEKINPKFFYYLSLSENFIDSIVSNSYGVSYPAINESFLMTLPVWYPKIEEQKEIAAFLDIETAKINGVIKKVEMQIEKLQEYRQALISSAVTGKIMVN